MRFSTGSRDFWESSRALLQNRGLLAAALGGALISAMSFGMGLGMMVPVFRLLLNRHRSLPEVLTGWIQASGLPDGVHKILSSLVGLLPQDPLWGFVSMMMGMLLLGLIGGAGRYLHELSSATVILRTGYYWRGRLFGNLVRSPLIEVYRMGSVDGISRLMTDVQTLGRGYEALLSRTLSELLNGAAGLAVALVLDWRLAGMALLGAPLFAKLLRRFRKAIRRASGRALTQYGKLLGVLQAALVNLSVVKIHSAERDMERRFDAVNAAVLSEEMSMRQAKSLSSPVIEGLALAAICGIASLTAWFIFRRDVEPARVLTLLLALSAAGAALRPIAKLSEKISEADAAAGRILELLRRPVEKMPSQSGTATAHASRHHREIVFEQVGFSYPAQNVPALDSVSFKVPHGRMVALVGANGSGKTTLLNLLPRLIEPSSGRVLIDGNDIARMDLAGLRSQIAAVPQETVLFQETIADNIRFGCPQAGLEEVIQAAKDALAHEFIQRLPGGYNHRLGEMGSGLSPGQKQRLAIARAILRNPSILILDEATSQLDPDSEVKIHGVLQDLRGKMTQFVIAHRLPTVMDADLILVMSEGRLVGAGHHKKLMQDCDNYRWLFQSHQILSREAVVAVPALP